MSHQLTLIAITIVIHLIFQIQCQDVPEEVCVSGAVDMFEDLNGEYELQEGTHNGFPFYKYDDQDENTTQYIYTYYQKFDDVHVAHYWVFYSELTVSYPESDLELPECSADGPDWLKTPPDPTQCVGGWVVYTNDTTGDYNLTDIIVEPGECETDVSEAAAVSGRSCYINIKSGSSLQSADPYDYSDPYVVLYGKYRQHINLVWYLGRTTTKWNNQKNPIWNEEFYIRYCNYDNLYFQVYDTDIFSLNDWMGDTNWRDVDLYQLPCGKTNYKRLYLNSDLDGDQGSLLVTVYVSC